MNKPLYVHDCEQCTFLGTFDAQDLYVCSCRGKEIDTLIARRSNEGSDYASGAIFALDYMYSPINDDLEGRALFIALCLAKKQGYTVKPWQERS